MNRNQLFFILLLGVSISGCTSSIDDIKNTYTISGRVGYEGFDGISGLKDFTVYLFSNNQIIASSHDEVFSFPGLEEGKSYTIIPRSLDFSRNGISTLDYVKVGYYIAGEARFSPFQRLAADMNSDNVIDERDLIQMRLCIVGAGQCPSYRFASEDYDGHGIGYVDQYTISHLDADTEANFIPVKIGDVNNTISFH